MKKTVRARIELILSMVIFGTIGIFRKYIPLPSSFLAMMRGFVGAFILLLFVLLSKKKPDRTAIRRNIVLLVLSGACIGVNWILLFEAYNYTSVATATLCYYFSPTFTILLAPLILHDRLTWKKMLCVLLALIGMVFVSGIFETGISGISEVKGIVFGLGAAVFYALVVIINKLMKPIGAYEKTIVQLFSAAAVLVPYITVSGVTSEITFTPFIILMLAIVCIVHTSIAYALFFASFEALPAHVISLFTYIDPVVAVILSALLLHEPVSVFTAAGALLILGSALWSEMIK